jgi:hypothetical protein
MGTYGLQEIIYRWERDQLTAEQAAGQILLLLLELEQRVQELDLRSQDHPDTSPPNRLSV